VSTRTVYGNTHSENGWPMVDADSCNWVTVPGTGVSLQIQQGQPTAILRAFAADFNAYVEPLRDADSACWTATNSVPTSNHLSGTGMDLNWNGPDGKTFRLGISEAQAYPGEKAARLRELLDFYEGMIFCGGNWSIRDWMHFQLGGNTYRNPKTADFINRKIRPDGYSTFRRGDSIPAPTDSRAAILARATGLSIGRATEILPAVTAGLQASDCTTINRIAMWLSQIGHESDSFNATEEYAKNGRYAPYIGRTWIQITWRDNYAKFGQWCYERGLVPYPDYFVDYPVKLAEAEWAGLGPAWYWTVARSDINQLSDAGDLVTVTRRINGGTNGLTDRQNRYSRALAVGDRLLALTTTTPADEWEELMAIEVESLSIYATPGEPKIPAWKLLQAIDAHGSHEEYVEKQAHLGEPDALARVARTAAGRGRYGAAPFAVNQAKDVLADIEKTNPAILQQFLATKGA